MYPHRRDASSSVQFCVMRLVAWTCRALRFLMSACSLTGCCRSACQQAEHWIRRAAQLVAAATPEATGNGMRGAGRSGERARVGGGGHLCCV